MPLVSTALFLLPHPEIRSGTARQQRQVNNLNLVTVNFREVVVKVRGFPLEVKPRTEKVWRITALLQ